MPNCLCQKPAKAIYIRERVHFVCATPPSRRPVTCICTTKTCACAASKQKCKYKLDYQTYEDRKVKTVSVSESTIQPDHTVVSKPIVIPTDQKHVRPSRRAAQRKHAV
jgi:hypothetical protein